MIDGGHSYRRISAELAVSLLLLINYPAGLCVCARLNLRSDNLRGVVGVKSSSACMWNLRQSGTDAARRAFLIVLCPRVYASTPLEGLPPVGASGIHAEWQRCHVA